MLAGRAREQAALGRCADRALDGAGRLVLIGGEAGIGKTALVAALTRAGEERAALVLTGHCYDLTETPPYGPWSEILDRLASPNGNNPPSSTAGRGPAGGPHQPDRPCSPSVRQPSGRGAAHQTLVLVLEDLHWADVGSLDLLRWLARSIADLPVLIVATYRSDDVTQRHPLHALLPLLVREVEPVRLDLRRLEPDAVRSLVTARATLGEADESRLVAYLEEHADGNPLYIGELLRTLEEERFLFLEQRDDTWTLRELDQAPCRRSCAKSSNGACSDSAMRPTRPSRSRR